MSAARKGLTTAQFHSRIQPTLSAEERLRNRERLIAQGEGILCLFGMPKLFVENTIEMGELAHEGFHPKLLSLRVTIAQLYAFIDRASFMASDEFKCEDCAGCLALKKSAEAFLDQIEVERKDPRSGVEDAIAWRDGQAEERR